MTVESTRISERKLEPPHKGGRRSRERLEKAAYSFLNRLETNPSADGPMAQKNCLKPDILHRKKALPTESTA